MKDIEVHLLVCPVEPNSEPVDIGGVKIPVGFYVDGIKTHSQYPLETEDGKTEDGKKILTSTSC
jgi:hypothetical protein